MGNFRCTTCGTSSDQAAHCAACGAHTFVLSREARVPALRFEDEPCGQLVSIADAPSLRRGRRLQPRRRRRDRAPTGPA